MHWVRLDKVLLSSNKYTGKNDVNGISVVIFKCTTFFIFGSLERF